MRSPGKYAAKTDGDINRHRANAYGADQKAHFLVSANTQARIELEVGSMCAAAAVPSLWKIYYLEFALQAASLNDNFNGPCRNDEVTGKYNLWATRGLSAALLEAIGKKYAPGWSVPVSGPSWAYKKTLTLSGNVSATTLTNFPVLVKLTAANFNFTHAQAAGQDIRFMAADIQPDTGTPLSHEIEYWDQAGQNAWIWVKVPSITGGSATDKIYFYFGNATAPDGQNKNAVWSNGYGFVHHNYDDPDTSHTSDSTGNGNTGTKAAAGDPSQTFENIGYCQNHPHTNSNISIPHSLTYDTLTDFSVEFTFRYTKFNANQCTVSKWPTAGAQEFVICLENSRDILFWMATNGSGGGSWLRTATLFSDATWYNIVVNITDTAMKVYINGVPDANTKTYSGTRKVYNYPLTLGDSLQSGYVSFNGDLDEVRMSKDARTADWIKADHLTKTNAFLTYGAEVAN
jgi:biopolymer transport protein ExbB